jgi:lytic murein transglycosylase
MLSGLAFGAAMLATGAALALTCQDPAGFDKWLDDVRREAAAQGISARAIEVGLRGVTYDPGIIRRDRGQRFFRQSFEQFSAKMVPPYRIQRGSRLLSQHASLLSRIERQFGVPGPILVAIWGLESDFGAARGNLPAIRSLATLAYDCRRTDLFTPHLFDALRIVQRGDLSPSDMRGAWAGELGQTQFMASNYYRLAVDFDGDGRRDLIRSVPDVLASTANYLRSHGWQRGESWEPGSANAEVLRAWNKSEVYARTIGYFASRLAGGDGPSR